MNIPKNIRSKLAKLRSSTLPLRIETGRFERLDINDRHCKFCNANPPCIETEYHFLFECSRYENERMHLYNHVLQYCPNFLNSEISVKWDIILNDKRILTKTGHYINEAMEVRNQIVYNRT
jgi:hypothetical protein